MDEIAEGIGTAVSGGLLARVLDPDSGAQGKHPHQPANCLNCDTPLDGAFCPACGQPAHIHRTIGGFLHDLIHGAFHFEGKFWRTMPMLVLRPGKLTRQYVEGKRARYVSPMALFLFTVFLMFAVFQMLGIKPPSHLETPALIDRPLEQANERAADDLASLQAELAELQADDPERASLEARIAELQRGIDDLAEVRATFGNQPTSGSGFTFTGIRAIDDGLAKKWNENPGLVLYKLQANSYKFSWLLIPISLPFVSLLFLWKRRFGAYDHAVFVTYSLSFMTMLVVILSLLSALGVGSIWLFTILSTVAPLHLYKHMKSAYGLSRFSTLWRFLLLSAFIWIVALLFVQALLLIGAF